MDTVAESVEVWIRIWLFYAIKSGITIEEFQRKTQKFILDN